MQITMNLISEMHEMYCGNIFKILEITKDQYKIFAGARDDLKDMGYVVIPTQDQLFRIGSQLLDDENNNTYGIHKKVVTRAMRKSVLAMKNNSIDSCRKLPQNV